MSILSLLRSNFDLKRCALYTLMSTSAFSSAKAERIEDILRADKFRLVFEYDFNQDSKPQDFDGTKIWDQNLWYGRNFNADDMKMYPDHLSLLTPAGDQEKIVGNGLTTWSKALGKPLVKFRYGYFEARMRYDWTTTNNFSAFWLESAARPLLGGGGKVTGDWCEIDIFEGGQKNVFSGTVHDWHNGVSTENQNQHTRIPSTVDYSKWNDYGALWDANFIRFYFNGIEISRTPTPAVCKKQDAFIVIGPQTRNQKAERIQLDVQRVRVLQN